MKVWITKYALTSGITDKEAEPCDKYGSIKYGPMQHAQRRQWHSNRSDALLKAEDMRLKKIASLKKNIQRLESMSFVEGWSKS